MFEREGRFLNTKNTIMCRETIKSDTARVGPSKSLKLKKQGRKFVTRQSSKKSKESFEEADNVLRESRILPFSFHRLHKSIVPRPKNCIGEKPGGLRAVVGYV